MIDLDKLPMTDGKLVNDKCKEKWCQKVKMGPFRGQSMINVDTWSMTNVNLVNDRCRHMVNDRCRHMVNDKFKLGQ